MEKIEYRFWNTDYTQQPIMEYGSTDDIKFVERSIGKDKMLLTRLKDNNGKVIYESDIIKYVQCLFNTNSENFPTKTKIVKWKFDRWSVYETNAGETNIEVIGNIFENPELLGCIKLLSAHNLTKAIKK